MLKRFAAALLLALMLPACALAESALLGVQVKDTAAPAAERPLSRYPMRRMSRRRRTCLRRSRSRSGRPPAWASVFSGAAWRART